MDPPKARLKDFEPGIVIIEDAFQLRKRFDLFFTLKEKSLTEKFKQMNDGTWVYEPEDDFQEKMKLEGDIKIQFNMKTLTGEEEFCSVWFNTNFIDQTG